MGCWGIKALESDEGLDTIHYLASFYNGKLELSLSEIISNFIKEGHLGKNREDIDYLHDNVIISIAELFLMFKEKGELDYDNDNESISLRKKTHFKSDIKSINYILQNLQDIKNEKPDKDGMREYVELWKESQLYENWSKHLDSLINKLTKINKK